MKKDRYIASYQEKFKDFLLVKDSLAKKFLNKDIATPSNFDSGKAQKYIANRMAIYRNNVFYSLGEALANLYPVTKRVVGDIFFGAISKQYISKYPPVDPVLTFYGEKFTKLIEESERCKHLPYLKDVALLEWHCQCSLHAADASVFDPASLGNMDEKALANFKFSIQPSAKFMISRFPVDTIWEENQKPEVGVINIDSNVLTHLLIYRKEFQIQVVNLQPTVYYLLSLLAMGEAISDAWEQAQAQAGELALDDEEFSGVLVYLLGLDVFCDKTGC